MESALFLLISISASKGPEKLSGFERVGLTCHAITENPPRNRYGRNLPLKKVKKLCCCNPNNRRG
jgi:hypothetical protein